MNINDFDQYISSYLDGELNESELSEFQKILRDNSECRKKLNNYKKMLDELSNLDILKTSDDFIDKLNNRLNNTNEGALNQKPKNLFGYNYIALSGIAASLVIFIFSISIFIISGSMPSFNLDKLSASDIKDSENKISHQVNLIAEDDSSAENSEILLPKIHLVGSEK